MMNRTHAVITDTFIYTIDPEQRKLRKAAVSPVSHISELWEAGQQMNISHFWIMPGTAIDRLGYDFLSQREGYEIFVIKGDMGNMRPPEPQGASCKKGREYTMYVSYPGREPFSTWTCNHPLDVLAAVDYLERELKIEVKWSPQAMGRSLLKFQYMKNKRRMSYLRDPEIDLSELPFASASPEILFMNLDRLQAGMYVHVFDKNSAHASAAQSVVMGVGDPIHKEGETEIKLPGIYRVKFSINGSCFDDVQLPKIIKSEWVTLDNLKFAVRKGYSVQVQEAYVFPEFHRIFEDWSAPLWQLRQKLLDTSEFPYAPGRVNARWTVKDMLTHTVSSYTKRPDWRGAMVGLARVAELANMEGWSKNGYYALFVYHDEIGYVSDDPNPAIAIPGVLERAGKLGGFKAKYDQPIRLTPQVLKTCATFTRVGTMQNYFKKIGEGVITNG